MVITLAAGFRGRGLPCLRAAVGSYLFQAFMSQGFRLSEHAQLLGDQRVVAF